MTCLPKELQQIAENELNEVPQKVKQDLTYFKEWLSKQHHIKARKDDEWLLTLLRICKWSLEKSKRQVDVFYSIKTALPEIFKNRDPLSPISQYFFKQKIISMLPPLTSASPIVYIIKCGRGDPNVLNLDEIIKFASMVYDVVMKECNNYIVGLVFYYDMKNTSFKFVKELTPTSIKKMVTCFQNAYPSRVKAVYFVNVPSMFMYISNILKSLVSKKLTQRIHFYSDNGKDGCQKYIPSSILPVDCGGDGPPMDSEPLQTLLETNRSWFKEDEMYGCDETKRPADSKLDVDLIGIDGFFRKLEVD